MKKICLGILLFFITTACSYGTEPMTIEQDLQRLVNKDSIVFVVRISAPIPYLRYEEYLRKYSSLKHDEIESRWDKENKELKSQFIVLRNLNGEEFPEGRIAELNAADVNFDFMSIGGGYIVYLTKNVNNRYEYEPYDVVNVAKIPSADLESVLNMSPKELTQFLIENHYFGNSDMPVKPKSRN
ncbi:hypothetical protein [Kangiella sp.]|uniref:hypothetical protein n=1 Tax=Kangiella sp. TaxID=1920245 RepID=UPI0019959681|nr:hypothetical protein [Kangiella sp.]MBD3654290.1 hypothetical protein [Kangiella sp.]